MFDSIRKHTKLMMGLLFLVTIPAFVLVGVDGFSRINASGPTVAEVGKRTITQEQWDRVHKQEAERMQAQQPNLDPKLLDTPWAKYSTLQRMVRNQVIGQATEDARLNTSDARLAAELMLIPGVRKADGTIDREAYNRYLQRSGYARAEHFEEQLRQDLALRLVDTGIVDTALESSSVTATTMNALFQRREVQLAQFQTSDYRGKVQIEQSDVESYYQAHTDKYKQPESAEIEYLVLDLEVIKKTVNVPQDDIKTYFDQNVARLSGKEERRASHILVAADKDATAEQRKAAKDKAQALSAQVRRAPQSFAELARKNSDDTNSAKKGGDLEYFGRGAMVKPFEEAVFSMKKGELSDVVESDLGYHVILVTDIKTPKIKTLDELRPAIEADLRTQLAQRKYAEYAQLFTDGVFEQPDTLKGVADKLKLNIQKARLVRDASEVQSNPVLSNPKLLEAVFSSDSLASKHNTNALELGGNQLVSARVLAHHPAQLIPLTSVQGLVREHLLSERAAELAKQDGKTRLQQWQSENNTPAALGASITVSRDQPQKLDQTLLGAILRADVSKLPAWVGVDAGAGGYVVVRIGAVHKRPMSSTDEAKREQARVAMWIAKAESDAYFEVLKKRMKVSIQVPNPVSR